MPNKAVYATDYKLSPLMALVKLSPALKRLVAALQGMRHLSPPYLDADRDAPVGH